MSRRSQINVSLAWLMQGNPDSTSASSNLVKYDLADGEAREDILWFHPEK
ncbi:hypothetical protein PSCICN_28470 [Pseudomonas cichorii]|nr:hypothetical protein PSCICN_28470 [Pseudomonas cichorii]